MNGAKKNGKKGRSKYKACHFYEYYLNKLGKLKLPNHVVRSDEDLILIESGKRSFPVY